MTAGCALPLWPNPGDERQAGFRLLAGKYAPELTEEALDTYIKSCAEEATVVRIEVEYIAGKANRGAAMG